MIRFSVTVDPNRYIRPVANEMTKLIWVLILLTHPARALACGLSPPIGPNGLPAVCHGDDSDFGMRAGVTAGGTATQLDFGEHSAELVQAASVATFDLLPTERLSLSAALGASLGGQLDYRDQEFDLGPGPIVGVGAAYRLFGAKLPFLHLSMTLSVSRSTARAEDGPGTAFVSRDVRAGVAIGKTLGSRVAPFVVVRAFGGGTHWDVAGGKGRDAFLYHVGIGSALGLSRQWDALLEIAFLGEKRATLGVGYLF